MIIMKQIFLIFFLILYSYPSFANDRCSEERKQWVEFYKQDFASNFSKIEYSDDPCMVSAISFEIKESGSNSLLNLGKELSIVMMDYLQKGVLKEDYHLKEGLIKNGVGIHHFTKQLKEMLADLNISQNLGYTKS